MTETPVNDITGDTHNVVEVNVDEGDAVIDLHTEDGSAVTDLRLSIDEALALIASLTVAVGEALEAR